MRRRVALLSMALGIVAAGQALALDATRVVYDLSELQAVQVTAPSSRGESQSIGLPSGNLPITTPSNGSSGSDGFIHDGNNLEIIGRRGDAHYGQDAASPRGRGRGRGHGRGHGHENDPDHGNGGGNGNGNGHDHGGGGNGGDPGNPTPNPEPGTLILVGSALAAGARRLRRRA